MSMAREKVNIVADTPKKRKRPSALDPKLLKTTLALGSVLATYLGADLMAQTDTSATAEPEPEPVAQVIEIQGSSTTEGFTLTLDPIPDVVSADQIPKPVAKSRSSN